MNMTAGPANSFELSVGSKRASLVIGAAYVLLSAALCIWLFGLELTRPSVYLELFDSKGYFSLGGQIFGPEAIDGSRLSQRGYLYASFAWLAFNINPLFLYFVQLFACAIGVVAIVRTEALLTGKILLSPLLLLVPSLMLSPARMMTEAFAFSLGALCLYVLMRGTHSRSIAIPLIWCAALIKPALLFPAIIVTLALLLSRHWNWKHICLAGLLVGTQLLLSLIHDGKIAFSTSGSANFAERFHPAVVGWSDKGRFVPYSSPEASKYRASSPESIYKLGDLAQNPLATVKAWGWILLHEHLLTKTGYVLRDDQLVTAQSVDRVRSWSGWVNLLMLPVWFLGLLGCFALAIRSNWSKASAALIAPICLASAPLVYWQGDRVVFYALLMLLPFAGLAVQKLFTGQSGDQSAGASSNPSN